MKHCITNVGVIWRMTLKAPQTLAWWFGLMASNEEVEGSIPHVDVVFTIVVHPTMVRSLDLIV